MRTSAYLLRWTVLMLLMTCASGCARRPEASTAPQEDGEAAARARFAEIQAAIKAGDAEKLWGLLSSKSRTDAEKEAERVRTTYEKASPEAKAALEKRLGPSGADLAKLTGTDFLKSKVFRDKGDEVAEGVVTRVTTGADTATVYFDEPDGDREKLVLLREDGRWKAWMRIPKVKTPEPKQ